MIERPSLFYAFATANEVYVRLAEIFIMGPEIFNDDCVTQCMNRILHEYLLPRACKGQLCLTLKSAVAGLDAFEPFYGDLLQHFEEFSLSNDNFALFVLLGAYANEKLFDGLLLKCAIWDPCRNIVRQMTTKKCHGFLERTDIRDTLKEKHFSQYSQLLAMYAAAIKNNRILRDRNPLAFEIASRELGHFIRDHEAGRNHENTVSCLFSMLKS
ncbi:unnamed protein product [Gongylonema pulchrum]|uniref:RPAP1/MINIYO-like TPR repeats domain-containing protein n=1 Tax=Gongylonema pulchrum TaxID=637853 RepID=A0A183E7T5_9BILA|nr:unnamed protein product [Gongylonema pulchrum]